MQRATHLILLLVLLCFAGAAAAEASAPHASAPEARSAVGTGFTYQGYLKDGGDPANGTYDFQFALYPTVTGGSQQGATVTRTGVTVTDGLFSVTLDFGLTVNADEYLEIAVRRVGAGAYTTLVPRQPLTAAPLAANAGLFGGQAPSAYQSRVTGTCTAGGALQQINADGSVECVSGGFGGDYWKLNGNSGTTPGTTAGANYLGTSDGQALVLGSNGAERLRVDGSTGNVGIGTVGAAPSEKLTVRGTALVRGDVNPVRVGSISGSAAGLSYPYSVYVAGRYAYVASDGNDSLVIFDVSNPASPALVGSSTDGLNRPASVYVAGRYAYVASYSNSSLVIFDVANPASPTRVGSSTDGLSYPYSVYVVGRYAYVASDGNDSLVIFDVSNPASPALVGSSTEGLSRPASVYVAGRYAYVASYSNSSLVIFDVANPASPTRVGSSTDGLSYPESVYVVGRYAYVASYSNSRLVIFDVSNPASPTMVGLTSAGLSYPNWVYVAGRYAYAASYFNNSLVVFDISNPASPTMVGSSTTDLNRPGSVYVAGRYAYVASVDNNSLVSFALPAVVAPTLEAGAVEAASLSVTSNAVLTNDLTVGGGLEVGPGGAQIGGDLGVQGGISTSGYIQIKTVSAAPPNADCSASTLGRMVIRLDTAQLYICTSAGAWTVK